MTDINIIIINTIRKVLNSKYENISFKDLKRFFKSKTNLKKLAKDIKYIGLEQIKNDYLDNLKLLLEIIFEDNEALIKDIYENKNIINFNDFLKIKRKIND